MKYGDGNGVLEPAEMLVPGNQVKFLDGDGNAVTSKTFSVTNTGEDTDYIVVLENFSVTYATTFTYQDGENTITQTEGEATTFVSNDFIYTLTCTIESTNADRNGTNCNGATNSSFPMKNGALIGNSISANDIHNYILTMDYKDNGNQSADMNKTLSAKLNIKDVKTLNPYSSNTKLLSYNIINNAITAKNGTQLMASPKTVPGVEASTTDEAVLSTAQDEEGQSYYFRGNVEDNYVTFAGLCWRIIRIEGDGSIRIILADKE